MSAILQREQSFEAQYNKQIVNCVRELPVDVRAKVAIRRIVRCILELITESKSTWEEVR
ncbi:hypothetical protein L1889_12260 [Paenalcaligenes niemegkensis]|uniref:hypothetical protein n=1 Tax=Paenalcaligenes niemegkensis TaxID=2895469 RepID=UPI001EE8013E|nr:hypothetical protein [Paenalcaligenes niemegkensis]MCQ9617373.1 hypothetical protein [Paenalcaligenes niemegkensis]